MEVESLTPLISLIMLLIAESSCKFHVLEHQSNSQRGNKFANFILVSVWMFVLPSLRYQGGNKFVKKTYPCVFIGYSLIHKGYQCYECQKNKSLHIKTCLS